jgi:hypothetical protein
MATKTSVKWSQYPSAYRGMSATGWQWQPVIISVFSIFGFVTGVMTRIGHVVRRLTVMTAHRLLIGLYFGWPHLGNSRVAVSRDRRVARQELHTAMLHGASRVGNIQRPAVLLLPRCCPRLGRIPVVTSETAWHQNKNMNYNI